ncbi:MAG: DUF192 domain-containing protein [Candidatus Altiarchaeota archaeon]|nr:DUF192 domain-containing protein [Candidatus Altiarchaeota archaeon]
MKRKTLAVIVVMVAFAALLAYYVTVKDTCKICLKDRCFDAEVVKTPAERSRGLMYRESLDPGKGMLFVFEQEGIHPFWMKNTLIPLDIIWISEDKKVVYVGRNAQPCQTDPCPNIVPEAEALYVLEVNAGTADEIGLETGDTVYF